MKYRYGGKEKRLALGVYPAVTLASAREKVRSAKLELGEGNDPSAPRKSNKRIKQASIANTFEAVASEFVEKRKQEGTAPVPLKN